MGADVALVGRIVVVVFVLASVYAERFLFVDIGPAHGDGDGENGNVHHNEVGDQDGRVEVGKVDVGKASGAGGGGLEPAVEDADTGGKGGDDGIFELESVLAIVTGEKDRLETYIQNNKEDQVSAVQNDQNPE